MNYAPVPGVPSMNEWAPEDIETSGAAMGHIRQELAARASWSAPKGGPGRRPRSS